MTRELPSELERVRDAARRSLGPVQPAGPDTRADEDFLFAAQRTEAGRSLPPYYLVYFLLVELLGFRNIGKFEKISWSVPIDFKGRAFLIEHRKFGIGIFAHNPEKEEKEAQQIAYYIKKGVQVAQPFFDWLAEEAVSESKLNVINNSDWLFGRFNFLRNSYTKKAQEARDRKDEKIVTEGETSSGGKWTSISYPALYLQTEARWLAVAAIEAFFSWTEHVFIHIAILSSNISSGKEVTDLAEADWKTKYKMAIDISNSVSKGFFDKLIAIRRELRNFVAHGAFGKDGKAFKFHSGAGAVPVLLPHRRGSGKFTMGEGLWFDDDEAFQVIEGFIQHLWSGPRAPAEIYIQNSQLPTILTMASDGTYADAMSSTEDMSKFTDRLASRFDQAANMDW